MRDVVILGSTGSIGVQVLEVIASNPQLFRVVAISSAGSNPELVIAQAKQFKVSHVGVVNNAEVVSKALPGITVIDGAKASTEIAAINCDVVVNAITGSIGLGPTLAALDAGNTLALANKESLVAAGELVMSRAREHQIIPVDSEHSAIFQSALAGKRSEIKKIVLTASGEHLEIAPILMELQSKMHLSIRHGQWGLLLRLTQQPLLTRVLKSLRHITYLICHTQALKL